MKKLISLLLVIIITCSVLSGCDWRNIFTSTTPSTTKDQDEKDPVELLMTEVISDYLIWSGIQSDKKPEEIEHEYLGKYGDSVAVYFHTSGAYETPIEEEISEYKFSYPDSRVVRIWNNGKFYKMSEAYELNLIDADAVKNIHSQYLNIEFSEPYFIYESEGLFDYKLYEQLLADDRFTLIKGLVVVGLDMGISTVGKEFDYGFFSPLEYKTIVNSSPHKNTNPEDLDQEVLDEFNHIFDIYLNDDSEETLFATIKILEQIDGIAWINLMYDIDDSYIYQSIPNDEFYDNEGNSEHP